MFQQIGHKIYKIRRTNSMAFDRKIQPQTAAFRRAPFSSRFFNCAICLSDRQHVRPGGLWASKNASPCVAYPIMGQGFLWVSYPYYRQEYARLFNFSKINKMNETSFFVLYRHRGQGLTTPGIQ
jgi:hypothetical protein